MKDIVWKIKSFEELSTKNCTQFDGKTRSFHCRTDFCYYLDADGYDEKAFIFCRKRRKIIAYCRIFLKIKNIPKLLLAEFLHPEFRNLQLGKNLIKFAF